MPPLMPQEPQLDEDPDYDDDDIPEDDLGDFDEDWPTGPRVLPSILKE